MTRTVDLYLLENAASQRLHLYFLSPVCNFIWRSRLRLCLNIRRQYSQRNGIQSACDYGKIQKRTFHYLFSYHDGTNSTLSSRNARFSIFQSRAYLLVFLEVTEFWESFIAETTLVRRTFGRSDRKR